MNTQAYFGDGVYGEFNGFVIILTANGLGTDATSTIYVEPHMVNEIANWIRHGYPDHSTGRPFTENT